jgi:hypothetical protein
MLRADRSPKPVYEQLKRLIHEEWQTRVSDATDAFGLPPSTPARKRIPKS